MKRKAGPPGKFPLLPRKKNTDKSRYGHVLVVAGSRGMTGAAVLASRAALMAGSGLVTLGLPESLQNIPARHLLEVMCLALPETPRAALSFKAFSAIRRFVQKRKIAALAVGPGLSQNKDTARLIRRLVKEAPVPVVLDADGLNSFKKRVSSLKKHASPLVLTPHAREFERLFSARCPKTSSARAALAKKLARFYDVVLVLKGHRTLVAGRGKIYENRTGNPGMAKGGSGDVLTGVIASFIGQGLAPFEAAKWAVYFHGKAGDLAVKKKSELSLLATDILDHLPKAFGSTRP